MGVYCSAPRIIEFNGLPGAGKTTIVKILRDKLERLGYSVYLSYYKKDIHRNGYSILLCPAFWGVIIATARYSLLFGQKRDFVRLLYLAMSLRMYSDFLKNNKNAYLIIDQGYVQYLIALAHKDAMPHSRVLDNLIKKSKLDSYPLLLVNCKVDIETSSRRMSERRPNGGRVESMQVEERLETLKTQEKNFEYTRRVVADNTYTVKIVEIDTLTSAEKCAEEILSHL